MIERSYVAIYRDREGLYGAVDVMSRHVVTQRGLYRDVSP